MRAGLIPILTSRLEEMPTLLCTSRIWPMTQPTYTQIVRNFVLDDLPLVYTFVGFQLFAAIGHVAMIATALFSKRVLRQPSWINFSFSWLVSALSYCILLFTGEIGAIVPTRGICLTQAALVTAMPPL